MKLYHITFDEPRFQVAAFANIVHFSAFPACLHSYHPAVPQPARDVAEKVED
jgi:hypothetical protein